MNRIAVLALLTGLLTATATLAQTTTAPTTLGDTTAYRAYVGTYKLVDAPVPELIVTLEGGKLMGAAEGQEKREITPDEKTADTFLALGTDVVLVFARDADRKVKKVTVRTDNQEFGGEKQP